MCPQQPFHTFCLLPCAAFRGRRVPTKGSGLGHLVDVAADSCPRVLGSLAAGALPARPGVCAELLGGVWGASRRLCWLSVSFSGFPGPGGSGAALPVAAVELRPGSGRSRRSSRPSRALSPAAWTPCTAFVPTRSGRGCRWARPRAHAPRRPARPRLLAVRGPGSAPDLGGRAFPTHACVAPERKARSHEVSSVGGQVPLGPEEDLP